MLFGLVAPALPSQGLSKPLLRRLVVSRFGMSLLKEHRTSMMTGNMQARQILSTENSISTSRHFGYELMTGMRASDINQPACGVKRRPPNSLATFLHFI
jgi:hypothetical protein